jgi:hypothetical protein
LLSVYGVSMQELHGFARWAHSKRQLAPSD